MSDIKTKQKRLLALYWLIVPLLVLAAITGAFSNLAGIPLVTTSSGDTNEEYIGAETCGLCHRTEYAAWNQSYHNNAGLLNITDGTKYYWMSPPWLHNGSTRLMDEAYFANCASCHTTGYDSATRTWPGSDSLDPEEAGAFLGVQCEVCHGPGGEHLDAPLDEKKDAISVDYSGSICSSCHSQYNDFVIGPHNSSLEDAPMDTCLSCHSTQGFLGQEVTLETEGLNSISCVICHTPHSATNDFQLREETQTETCGSCHTGTLHHPQYDLFTEGPHEKAGLDCTSCHGQGEALIRGSVTEHFNHTFAIYDTYYPFNQTDPMVCTKCHDQTWATTQLGIIQGTTEEVIANVTKAIHEADTAIATASQTSGVDQTKISEAVELFEAAEHWVEYVENDKSSGLHNPEATFELLSEAWRLAGEANSLAINAQQEATSGQLTSVQSQLTSVQEDLSSVQGNLNSTQTYMYVGAIGGIIGGLILGLLVGRRWTSA